MVPLFYICPLQLINLRSSSFQNMVHSHRRTCSCLFINNHQREGRHERNKQMQLRWHPAWWLSPRQSLPWTWQYSLINVTIIIALMLATLTINAMWGATHVGQFFFTLAQLPPAFHFKVKKMNISYCVWHLDNHAKLWDSSSNLLNCLLLSISKCPSFDQMNDFLLGLGGKTNKDWTHGICFLPALPIYVDIFGEKK